MEKAPNRTSTARQTTTEISRRFRCSSSSNAPWSLSWSYRQTAPTTWFRFITGEAARLEKAPSWYSLEKASVAPEGGDHLSNEGIFPQGGGSPVS